MLEEIHDVLGPKQHVAFDDLAKLKQLGLVTLPFLATFFEPKKEKKTHTDTSEFTRLLGIVGWPVFGLNSSWLVATV